VLVFLWLDTAGAAGRQESCSRLALTLSQDTFLFELYVRYQISMLDLKLKAVIHYLYVNLCGFGRRELKFMAQLQLDSYIRPP
jgi:hypothetical protein